MLSRHGRQCIKAGIGLIPVICSEGLQQQQRDFQLFEIFSKERREERRRKLLEETNRGYFDDFRDFRDTKGKVFYAPERLIPAADAQPFPQVQASLPTGEQYTFPPSDSPAAAASLVCTAFRAGAETMLEAWAGPFSQEFEHSPGVALYELALVESPVMRVWPFKQMILKGGAKDSAVKYKLPATYLYSFGNTDDVRKALYMTNRLTGYLYLVDRHGRIRWRGSGNPQGNELVSLLKYTRQLLNENEKEKEDEIESATSE